MTLYELTAEYAAIMAALEAETEEEYQEELLNDLAALNEDIAEKGEGYARVIRNMEAEADGLAAEIKRLQGMKKRREDAIERMKAGLLEAMKTAGADKLQTTIGKWSRRLNPPSVVILDPKLVPSEYLIHREPDIDKFGILAEYKASGKIAAGTNIVRKESVSFR